MSSKDGYYKGWGSRKRVLQFKKLIKKSKLKPKNLAYLFNVSENTIKNILNEDNQ